MTLRESLVDKFQRSEDYRVHDLRSEREYVQAYRDALGSLLGRTSPDSFKAPCEAEVDVDVETFANSVVVRLEYGDREDFLDVLVVGRIEDGLRAYVLGSCWACGRQVPLRPALDPKDAERDAGLALTVNEPAAMHRCREGR